MLDLLENPNSLLYLLLPLCVCALVAYVLLPEMPSDDLYDLRAYVALNLYLFHLRPL